MVDLETLDTYEEMLRNGELDSCSQLELIEWCRELLETIDGLRDDIRNRKRLDQENDGWDDE